jgi:hypothetical protein
MTPLVAALALLAQTAEAPAAQASEVAAPPPSAANPSFPPGAPTEPYQFVGWCYGALRGYLEMHDEVMPEVKRIENTWRKPGTSLADDLKVYADQQVQGKKDLAAFQRAMTAAEKASLRPINTIGAQAVRKGRATWTAASDVTVRRKAQEWMSWTLPAACQTTAAELEKRAVLMGASFRVNAEEAAAPAQPAPAADAAPETAQAPAPAAQ